MEVKKQRGSRHNTTNYLSIHTKRDTNPHINFPENGLTVNNSSNVNNFNQSPGLKRKNEYTLSPVEEDKNNIQNKNNLNVAGINFLRRISSVIRGGPITINNEDENFGSLILDDVDEMLNFEAGKNFKYYFPENNPEAILESLKLSKMNPTTKENKTKKKRRTKNERHQSYVRVKEVKDRSFLATFMRKVVKHPSNQNDEEEEKK